MKRFAVILFVIAASVSCGQSPGKDDGPSKRRFPMVKVPMTIEPEQKAEYLAEHYWDAFADVSVKYPCDTGIVNGVPLTEVEQAMANYINLLGSFTLDETAPVLTRLCNRLVSCEAADSSSNVLEQVADLLDKYLYDPNSPLRDEDVFTPVARRLSECEFFTVEKRSYYARAATNSTLNRRGTKAADFSFSDRNGRVFALYGIKADLTVLFFSNPGCTACKEIIDALGRTQEVDRMVDDGTLAVLNIYIDEDLGEWFKYMSVYPGKWYNGYDHNHIIRDDTLYDVRAIPSLYLLDRDKKVIMKDVPLDRVMNYLMFANKQIQ